MQFLLTQLTVACVLAHAIMGCCANHGCSVEYAANDSPRAAQEAASVGCSHAKCSCDNELEEQDNEQHHHPSHHQCDHESCQWIAGDDGQLYPIVSALDWFSDCYELSLISLPPSLSGDFLGARSLFSKPEASLRLHLALGVLQV